MRRTYRRVATTYWTDPEIRRLKSPDAHVLLLYLFTGPDSVPGGLYWQPRDTMAARTRLPLERVDELLELFEDRGWIAYDRETEEVLVVKAMRHQIGPELKATDNRWKGLLRAIADTHSERLVRELVNAYPEAPWPDEVVTRARTSSSPPSPSGPTVENSVENSTPKGNRSVENSTVENSVEGASEGLPSRGSSRSSAPPKVSTEGASKHSISMSVSKSVSSGIDAAPMPEGEERFKVRITDAVLRQEALAGMGLGRFTKATDLARVNREIQELLRDVGRENLLAAMRGFAKLRDAGELGLKPGRPYTPKTLVRWDAKPDADGNPGVWWGEGDARTKRRLLDLAQDLERDVDRTRGEKGGALQSLAELLGPLTPGEA